MAGIFVTEISVLMPAYNCAKTISSSIETIMYQSFQDFEIVIINDGSYDETSEILQSLSILDSRIKIINQKNLGIVDALNNGLEICDAPFIARHDADDLSVSDRLIKQLSYLKDHPECVAVSGDARHIDENGRWLGTYVKPIDPENCDPSHIPAIEPYLMHPFLMMRTDVVRSINGYRHVPLAEDADLYWRLMEKGQLKNLPDVLGDYRIHINSSTAGSIRNGRVLAVSSQLAALSAKRRMTGKKDLDFPQSIRSQLNGNFELADLYRIFSKNLTYDEMRWFQIAISAKLLEVSGYKPFEPTLSDCKFAKLSYVNNISSISIDKRSNLARTFGFAAARLFILGSFHESLILCLGGTRRFFISRVIIRLLLPTRLRRKIRRLLRKPGLVK